MNSKKALMSLMLTLTIAMGMNPKANSLPVAKQEFELTYYDIRADIMKVLPDRTLIVDFDITEDGKVENARISDPIDLRLSDTVISKVMALKFQPALQNGRPVRVRYKLPIVFK